MKRSKITDYAALTITYPTRINLILGKEALSCPKMS